MAELFGKRTGICRGQGGSMHMFSSEYNFLGGFAFIGEGIPIGAGAAFRSRYGRDVLHDETADQVNNINTTQRHGPRMPSIPKCLPTNTQRKTEQK